MRRQRSDLREPKAPRIAGTPNYRQISRDLGKRLWLPPDLPVVKRLPTPGESTISKE